MKLPEFLFPLINAIMKVVLRSPLHSLMSKQVMLIEFTGKKSGRLIQTPVSYTRSESEVVCFTTKEGKWWYSFRNTNEEALTVNMLIAGREYSGSATALHSGEADIGVALTEFLLKVPGNAAYHEITLNASGKPNEAELDAAVDNSVLIKISIAAQAQSA